MSDQAQKTEQPTPRRLEKARQEGRFAVSREFVASFQFCVFVALLIFFSGEWLSALSRSCAALLTSAFRTDRTPVYLNDLFTEEVTRCVTPLAFGGALLVLASVAAHLVTTRMGFAFNRLAPDFQRLNPMGRLRELPRQNMSMLMQSLVLLPLAGLGLWKVVEENWSLYAALPFAPARSGLSSISSSLATVLWRAAGVFAILGAIDLFRQRRKHMRDLRMTKQEIREEFKESEGNPQIKMRIRRIQRDLLRRRMMSQVPKATAVIVNPTHYAVAIRYSADSMAAPSVIAKGKNYLALRIREKAREHEIPIIENPPLAQALYKSVEVGQEIPPHLYRAVAEILAYIYRLMNGRLPGS
jgi:flagellar biosynthetic protein FlhB